MTGTTFAIDEGVLTFRAPPDYEQPADRDTNNVYQVTVVASDGANRGTLGVTVTVTEQNEGPVVSGTPEFTVVENRDLPNAVYTARDPEAVGGVTTAITWSLSGRDGGGLHHRPGYGSADLPQPAGPRAASGRQPGQRVRGHRAGPRRTELRRLRGDGDGGGTWPRSPAPPPSARRRTSRECWRPIPRLARGSWTWIPPGGFPAPTAATSPSTGRAGN